MHLGKKFFTAIFAPGGLAWRTTADKYLPREKFEDLYRSKILEAQYHTGPEIRCNKLASVIDLLLIRKIFYLTWKN